MHTMHNITHRLAAAFAVVVLGTGLAACSETIAPPDIRIVVPTDKPAGYETGDECPDYLEGWERAQCK